jgi:hypothetical protein
MAGKCSNCGAVLEAEPSADGMVRCGYCGGMTRLAPPAPLRPLPTASRRVQVLDTGTELTLRYRWFTPVALFLVFFCIAWDSFLIFWYAMAFGGGAPCIFIIFPIAHVAVGVGLSYFTLALLLNSTEVRLTRYELSIRHGPLPWRGNQTLAADDIRQLYCKRQIRHGKNGVSITYDVHALLKDGQGIKLLSGLNDEQQALFIEKRLEQWMGIRDQAVEGEVGRGGFG